MNFEIAAVGNGVCLLTPSMTSRTLLDVVFPAPRFHHLPALTYHDGVSSRTFSYADIIEEAQQISQVLLTHQKNGIVALDVKQSQFLVPCLILR